MADIPAVVGVGGISAVVGAIASVFGIKKVIDSELQIALMNKVHPLEKEVEEVKAEVKELLSKDEHLLICTLTSKNVDQKFDGLREHMDTKFAELARCLEQPR